MLCGIQTVKATLQLQERNQNSLTPNPFNSNTAQSPEAEMSMWFACNMDQESIMTTHFWKKGLFLPHLVKEWT